MKKVLLSIVILYLMMMSSVLASTKTISDVSFKFMPPYGDGPRIEEDDIHVSEGVKIVGFTWVNPRTHTFMQSTEKYEEDYKYELRMFFEPDEGYEFAPMDELEVSCNNVIAKIEFVKEPSQYKFEMSFLTKSEEASKDAAKRLGLDKPQTIKPVDEAHPLKMIEVKVDKPEAGNNLPEKCQIKTNLTGKYVEYEVGKRAEDGFYPYWDTKFFPGLAYGNVTYTFRVKLFDDSITPNQSKNIEGYINGEECYGGRNSDGSINLFISYKTGEMPPEEKKEVVIAFSFTIDAPKVGEKPSKNAKEVFDGYEATKVVWTPNDKVFEAGKEYKVEIFYKIEDGYTYFGEIKTWINNKEVIEQGWDEDHYLLIMDKLCAEYTFPKLEGTTKEPPKEETKKVEWTKASNWAVEELNKANEKELIPEIFEKQDLTTNITRREFAHIAVRLWEAVSGQTMAAGPKTPFSDCDDPEVLKAYNLEITKGTSDTTFSPNDLITREQMATMMTRALSKAGINVSVDLDKVEKFADDNEIHSWGKEAVYYMSSIGIIKGVGDNNFGVVGDASKEQSLLISVRSAEKFSR